MQKPQAIATWNPERDLWETSQVDIFGHSVAFSETLPKSGMTRNGQLYGLPTLAPPTTDPGYSSSPLLPTPVVNDMGAAYNPTTWDEWTERMKQKHGNGNGHGKSLNVEAQRLLPTPAASDPKRDDNPSQAMRKSPGLTTVSAHFPRNDTPVMPTPTASDATGGGQHPSKRVGHTRQLIDTVLGLTSDPTPPLFDIGSD